MYQLHIAEKRRVYPDKSGDAEVKEEWVTTHDITVPDKETLAAILGSLSEQMQPNGRR